jgi:hypothetical protein
MLESVDDCSVHTTCLLAFMHTHVHATHAHSLVHCICSHREAMLESVDDCGGGHECLALRELVDRGAAVVGSATALVT